MLYGITETFILIYCFIFGILLIYKSRVTNAKLLGYIGFVGIGTGLIGLGACIDFFTILLTGKNMDNTYSLRGLLGFMWAPILVGILLVYIMAELLMPKLKWPLVTLSTIGAVIVELFLFLDPMSSLIYNYPSSPGEDLIYVSYKIGSPAFFFMIIYFLFLVIFCAFGFLYKSILSTGVIKKKFQFLSFGAFLAVGAGIVNNLYNLEIINSITFSIFSISCNFLGYYFFYLGLKEEPEEPNLRPKKEVKVAESIFRLSKKPAQITEEEVSISKEKQICLVCKGNVVKIIYLCPECRTFYCIKCVDALTNQENACWVCSTPFDESKPVKPFKKEEQIEEIKISK